MKQPTVCNIHNKLQSLQIAHIPAVPPHMKYCVGSTRNFIIFENFPRSPSSVRLTISRSRCLSNDLAACTIFSSHEHMATHSNANKLGYYIYSNRMAYLPVGYQAWAFRKNVYSDEFYRISVESNILSIRPWLLNSLAKTFQIFP